MRIPIYMLVAVFLPPLVSAAQTKSRVFGDPALSQWPPSRTYHVENYLLKLHFDAARGEVFGDELVTLRPFQPRFRKFYLGNSRLEIDSVTLQPEQGAAVKLAFTQTDPRLWITLNHDYDAATVLKIRIVYHGFPKTGLFFVNPSTAYPHWPREIWSQGEPEFNHFWFPCWDYPNDMATSETITTVPEGQMVVSNGKLISVTHSAGSATYDWKESVPHSSYLISIAIGPWRKISDHYENKPVDYYVPQYVDEATARRSFNLTPDMLSFFSSATGVDYPYEQYAQTTVHNYIFGGMENVSATTLTESTLHDQRADQDYPSTDLVSHELGQEWLGDLVQGRDWANIRLNEGFATYLEALYVQHHEGNDAFRYKMYMDQMAEQTQDREDYRRPIVDRHYTDPLQMFDAITHEKGATVLDMLRYLLDGSEAEAQAASQEEPFFRAVRYYLTAHRAQAADIGGIGALVVGMIVMVDADLQADGTLLAREVGLAEHDSNGMQAEGLIVGITGNPATQLALVAHDGAGSGMSHDDMGGTITVNLDSNTAFSIDSSHVDLTGLPFTPAFSGSNIFKGQSVEVVSNTGMGHDGGMGNGGMHHGTVSTATEVNLEEQGLRGVVANYSANGNQATFTLNVAPDSVFASLTATTSITVYQQPSTALWGLNSVTNGTTVEVHGLLFVNLGTYTLVASRIVAP